VSSAATSDRLKQWRSQLRGAFYLGLYCVNEPGVWWYDMDALRKSQMVFAVLEEAASFGARDEIPTPPA
jgi:hypothetical protein